MRIHHIEKARVSSPHMPAVHQANRESRHELERVPQSQPRYVVIGFRYFDNFLNGSRPFFVCIGYPATKWNVLKLSQEAASQLRRRV